MTKISSLPGSNPLYLAQPQFVKAGQPVFHGFFTRHGGVSKGIYASLNCGVGSNDDPASVQQNRNIVAQAAGCSPENLLTLYQVHGDACLTVAAPWPGDQRPQADAFVTDRPGLALGILTADCAPVLFHGAKPDGTPVIGAAHAGWKGALCGALESAVRGMVDLGADISGISACIGPCIGKRSYEVSDEFMKNFLTQDAEHESFFQSARKAGHALFDLAGFCAARLQAAGVGQVLIMDRDTYREEDDFFSYRRKTHKQEPDYARQISVIMIKDQG
jgi:YfiH family protein